MNKLIVLAVAFVFWLVPLTSFSTAEVPTAAEARKQIEDKNNALHNAQFARVWQRVGECIYSAVQCGHYKTDPGFTNQEYGLSTMKQVVKKLQDLGYSATIQETTFTTEDCYENPHDDGVNGGADTICRTHYHRGWYLHISWEKQ